ncbi:MAG: TRAP transporter TatT component family protein [Gammaproteobacteria bacterium]|nr:TRAP transporter TatT component family protein [Gammaproteobacteria bacterium]MDP6695474.1 TRAP transporter TatT component family protein [Gammaproteobacteria bacterium]
MVICKADCAYSRSWQTPALGVVLTVIFLTGCSSVVSSVSEDFSASLSSAMLNQEDPELVREALPAYMLLLDSMIDSYPDDVDTLSAGAKLYAVYGAALVNEPHRAAVLTSRAREYGERALCSAEENACELGGLDFDSYLEIIHSIDGDDVEALYSYSLANLAWIRANSHDYGALAGLPKVEASLEHIMELRPGELAASTCMYLGILNTLRPAALGGEPDIGRMWFERGIRLSDGNDLSIKVEYARGYGRLIYNRELHDRLLNEVLAADVKQSDLTLFNMLAQEQAAKLLESADEYF